MKPATGYATLNAGPVGDLPLALPGFERINRYFDPQNRVFTAKILPGEYYVTHSGEMIATVLGSCVSACIRDPLAGIGGMNHFMLPDMPFDGQDQWGAAALSAATRYGSYAMEHMINDILKWGGRRERLEVKICGGGRIFSGLSDVGAGNIRFVETYLRSERLPVLSRDLGGLHPRKVQYFPATGRARIMKLGALHNRTLIDREEQYLHSLQTAPVAGEVELF